jgi:hypothetical protein
MSPWGQYEDVSRFFQIRREEFDKNTYQPDKERKANKLSLCIVQPRQGRRRFRRDMSSGSDNMSGMGFLGYALFTSAGVNYDSVRSFSPEFQRPLDERRSSGSAAINQSRLQAELIANILLKRGYQQRRTGYAPI